MTGWQVLWRVELPLAIPLLMAGVRTAALFVISTTTIAALAGYNGQPRGDRQQRGRLPPLGRARRRDLHRAMAIAIELVLALVQRA